MGLNYYLKTFLINKTMLLLSFDIGIKNLAYCLMDTTDNSILDWFVLDCIGQNETMRVLEEIDSLNYLT